MGMLYRRKKNGVETGPWWMKYYDHGKPIYQSTEKLEKREAQLVLKRAELKIAEGQREGGHIQRARFEDLIPLLKEEYTLKKLKSWDRRSFSLKHLEPVFKGVRLKTITTDKLKAFVTQRLKEGAAPASVNCDLGCFRKMLHLGAQLTPPLVGRIPHFPMLAENNVREGFLEHDEFLAIRGAAKDRLKIAMTIAYYTGMRLREIISERGLRWEQVDLEEGSIRLSSSQTKTKSPRIVYMGDDFLRVMRRAREVHLQTYPESPYICHYKGKPFDDIDRLWASACRRVGVKGRTFHDLRRTGVRNLIRAGVPETVAMKISGHKTRAIFDRYNITSEDDLKEAAAKLNSYIQKKKVTLSVTLSNSGFVTPEEVPSKLLKEKAGTENDF